MAIPRLLTKGPESLIPILGGIIVYFTAEARVSSVASGILAGKEDITPQMVTEAYNQASRAYGEQFWLYRKTNGWLDSERAGLLLMIAGFAQRAHERRKTNLV